MTITEEKPVFFQASNDDEGMEDLMRFLDEANIEGEMTEHLIPDGHRLISESYLSYLSSQSGLCKVYQEIASEALGATWTQALVDKKLQEASGINFKPFYSAYAVAAKALCRRYGDNPDEPCKTPDCEFMWELYLPMARDALDAIQFTASEAEEYAAKMRELVEQAAPWMDRIAADPAVAPECSKALWKLLNHVSPGS